MASSSESATNATPRTTIQGLDGIRAIAILLVMLFHARVVAFGWIGVPVFFVLSGYLITGILAEDREAPLGQFLRCFYGRRFLRIFPAYFLYLGFLTTLVYTHGGAVNDVARAQLPYAFTYTYDFSHASRFFVHNKFLTHFWSLAIEEQFYLLWPFVVYLCPKRVLARVTVGLVCAGPALRLGGLLLWKATGLAGSDTATVAYVLPGSHIDAFATGALLCFFRPRLSGRVLLGVLGAIVALLIAVKLRSGRILLGMGLPDYHGYVWGYAVMNLLSLGLIVVVRNGGTLCRVLSDRRVAFLGRISYGVYIVHFPLTLLTQSTFSNRFGEARMVWLAEFLLNFAASVTVASLSFFLIERPLLRSKDRWFPRLAKTRDTTLAPG